MHNPSDGEDFGDLNVVLESVLDLGDELFLAGVDLVLGFEEILLATGAEGLEVFLAALEVDLGAEVGGETGLPGGLLDLGVQVVDFGFEPVAEVVGPAVELVDLFGEKGVVAILDTGEHGGLAVPEVVAEGGSGVG